MYSFFIGLLTLLIPLLIIAALFTLCIVKIPAHYAKGNTGKIFLYSIILTIAFMILLFMNSPTSMMVIKMLLPQ